MGNEQTKKLISYDSMSEAQLKAEFEIEKQAFESLPKKGSFSGLAISERCERIQQIMEERGYSFEPFYMEINVEVG